MAADRRWAAGEPRAKLGGGNGDCRIDKLTWTDSGGGGWILDAQQVAEADCESGSAPRKKVDEGERR